MPETIRQQIVNEIVSTMEEIDGTGDYQTTVGENVHDFRINFQDDELPALSVCDVEETLSSDVAETESHYFFRLGVRIRVAVDAEARPEECRMYIADILTAIRSNDRWIDRNGVRLALQTDFVSASFELDEESHRIAAVEVIIAILYATQRFNPYEQ